MSSVDKPWNHSTALNNETTDSTSGDFAGICEGVTDVSPAVRHFTTHFDVLSQTKTLQSHRVHFQLITRAPTPKNITSLDLTVTLKLSCCKIFSNPAISYPNL